LVVLNEYNVLEAFRNHDKPRYVIYEGRIVN